MKHSKLIAMVLALLLAAGALSGAVPAGGASAPADEAFYQDLARLTAEDAAGVGGQADGSDRVIAWSDAPLDLGGLDPDAVLQQGALYIIRFRSPQAALDARDILRQRDGVTASLDGYRTAASPGDTRIRELSSQADASMWWVEYSGFPEYVAANAGRFTDPVQIGVIDTQIDAGIPWLGGWLNTGAGADFTDGASDPANHRSFHGSFVAGEIVSCLQGVPNVRVVPLRAMDDDGTAPDSWIISAIQYSVEQGIDVINMSLGGGHSDDDALDEAVKRAAAAGVVVVCAAGNDGADVGEIGICPGHVDAPGVLCVGASNEKGDLTGFSNYGPLVDLLAPGDNIDSCVPGGNWETWAGTSMAAPLVSAASALLLSAEPELQPAEAEAMLKAAVNEKGVLDLRALLDGGTTPSPSLAPSPTPSPTPAAPGGEQVHDQAYRYLGYEGSYTGQWSGGKPDGQGKLTFASGSAPFRYLSGTWKNGAFLQGDGQEVMDDGTVYTGGYAMVSIGDGFSFLWNGQGVFNFPSGDWSESTYDHGEPVRTVWHTKDGETFVFE